MKCGLRHAIKQREPPSAARILRAFPLTFPFYPVRFQFTAREPIHFPAGNAGNILRGAFGGIFRKLACSPQCSDARTCSLRSTCAYARIFEPAALAQGPSGLADWPRPFVFRAAHLDGRTIMPGNPFHFNVNIFAVRDPALIYFVLAFAELALQGLGPNRGIADLVAAHQLNEEDQPEAHVYDGVSFLMNQAADPVSLDLDSHPRSVSHVQVRFVTPTELKSGHQLAVRPEFSILFARIRDRISTLRALYGAGPLEIDFKSMAARAAGVEMSRCDIYPVDISRRSSRTGQVHSIGGFAGVAEYRGDLSEFVPYLHAGRWTGVGRQTVWGKGEMQVTARG